MKHFLTFRSPRERPYLRVDTVAVRHETFAGSQREVVREVLAAGKIAAVLPVDVRSGRIVMIEQFRIGAAASGQFPWLLEFVAGAMDEGETLEAVARRELFEEGGLRAGRVEPVLSWLSSPGVSSEELQLFVAEVEAPEDGGIFGLDTEGEDIRVRVFPIDAVEELIADPRAGNSLTLIALQWLLLHYASLQERWLR